MLAEQPQAGHVGFITGAQMTEGMTAVVQFLDMTLNGNATARVLHPGSRRSGRHGALDGPQQELLIPYADRVAASGAGACQQTDITAAVGPPKTAAEIVAPQETTAAAVAMFES